MIKYEHYSYKGMRNCLSIHYVPDTGGCVLYAWSIHVHFERKNYYLHFTNEEPETERASLTCIRY